MRQVGACGAAPSFVPQLQKLSVLLLPDWGKVVTLDAGLDGAVPR